MKPVEECLKSLYRGQAEAVSNLRRVLGIAWQKEAYEEPKEAGNIKRKIEKRAVILEKLLGKLEKHPEEDLKNAVSVFHRELVALQKEVAEREKELHQVLEGLRDKMLEAERGRNLGRALKMATTSEARFLDHKT